MSHVQIQFAESIATVTLARGKVNALNLEVVRQLADAFAGLRDNTAVRGVILTGRGPFFSFGFDVPELRVLPRERFAPFVREFTTLYANLFTFPKPIVAAINGHAVAGGCMIALAADYRLMVTGKPLIGLNEVTFGAAKFAGSVEMLRHAVGGRWADRVSLLGRLYSPDEAHSMGLVDEICEPDKIPGRALAVATEYAHGDPSAYSAIKRLIRGPVGETMAAREDAAIRDFLDIWYSESTRRQLMNINIRE